MKAGIAGRKDQLEEIRQKSMQANAVLVFSETIEALGELSSYDWFFYLHDDADNIDARIFNNKPVFINEVIYTLKQKNMPAHFYRLNGWKGFLQRDVWEIAGDNENAAASIFEALGWKYIFVKDEPGLVAARVISMIINEAFFALEEKISTIEEIDKAMKLGTGYQFGPFEWLDRIGTKNICNLLKQLAVDDERYVVSPLLQKKFEALTVS